MTPLSRFRVPRLGAALLALAVPAALHAQLVRTGTARPLPLSLSEALALGAGGSEAVALARAGVERAEGQQRQARSARLPQLSSSLAWQKQLQNQFAEVAKRAARGTGGTGGAPATGGTDSSGGGDGTSAFTRIFASEYNLNAGLVASQPLFTGGRGRAGVVAARAGRQAAEGGVTAAEAQAQRWALQYRGYTVLQVPFHEWASVLESGDSMVPAGYLQSLLDSVASVRP
jgi:outer membrane protein TolC